MEPSKSLVSHQSDAVANILSSIASSINQSFDTGSPVSSDTRERLSQQEAILRDILSKLGDILHTDKQIDVGVSDKVTAAWEPWRALSAAASIHSVPSNAFRPCMKSASCCPSSNLVWGVDNSREHRVVTVKYISPPGTAKACIHVNWTPNLFKAAENDTLSPRAAASVTVCENLVSYHCHGEEFVAVQFLPNSEKQQLQWSHKLSMSCSEAVPVFTCSEELHPKAKTNTTKNEQNALPTSGAYPDHEGGAGHNGSTACPKVRVNSDGAVQAPSTAKHELPQLTNITSLSSCALKDGSETIYVVCCAGSLDLPSLAYTSQVHPSKSCETTSNHTDARISASSKDLERIGAAIVWTLPCHTLGVRAENQDQSPDVLMREGLRLNDPGIQVHPLGVDVYIFAESDANSHDQFLQDMNSGLHEGACLLVASGDDESCTSIHVSPATTGEIIVSVTSSSSQVTIWRLLLQPEHDTNRVVCKECTVLAHIDALCTGTSVLVNSMLTLSCSICVLCWASHMQSEGKRNLSTQLHVCPLEHFHKSGACLAEDQASIEETRSVMGGKQLVLENESAVDTCLVSHSEFEIPCDVLGRVTATAAAGKFVLTGSDSGAVAVWIASVTGFVERVAGWDLSGGAIAALLPVWNTGIINHKRCLSILVCTDGGLMYSIDTVLC